VQEAVKNLFRKSFYRVHK